MPAVSVIMGIYNGEKYMKRAIESILQQSFEDFELIICNDASTDGTEEILNMFAQKDGRIKVIKNKRNRRLAASLNACIRKASGEYIARMDDDDVSLPERLERQVAFLKAHEEYALVGAGAERFDENGAWGTLMCREKPTLEQCFEKVQFIHPTTMIRRHVLEQVGGYSERRENYRTEDYDLWCRIYEKGYRGYNLQEVLLKYYESENSIKRRKKRHRLDLIRNKFYWRKRLGLPFRYNAYVYLEICKLLIPNRVLLLYRKHKQRST